MGYIIMIDKKDERIGKEFINKWQESFIIINYSNANNIMIEFANGYKKKVTWQQIQNKQCETPYSRIIQDIGYHGEGKYNYTEYKNIYYHWEGMLRRCYNKKYQDKKPTYIGCQVCDEWLSFQNFAQWYEENYYEIEGEEMNLDKDILVKGNKIYSPSTCIFVPKRINGLFTNKKLHRGDLPIGITKMNDNRKKPYQASCCDGYGNRVKMYFTSVHEAFLWYKFNKELVIQGIANEYKNVIPIELYEAMYRYEVEVTD